MDNRMHFTSLVWAEPETSSDNKPKKSRNYDPLRINCKLRLFMRIQASIKQWNYSDKGIKDDVGNQLSPGDLSFLLDRGLKCEWFSAKTVLIILVKWLNFMITVMRHR